MGEVNVLDIAYYATHTIDMRLPPELMRGAGPIAVLKLLESREMYGYEMIESLSKTADGVLDLGQATLYPMLYNLEEKGWVASKWRESGSGRRRKYYGLTAAGRRELASRLKQWRSLEAALRELRILPGAAS